MKDVERLEIAIIVTKDNIGVNTIPSPTGPYVTYENIARLVRENAELKKRFDTPDGYAYVYPDPLGGGDMHRFNNGETVNGCKPHRAIPFYFGREK